MPEKMIECNTLVAKVDDFEKELATLRADLSVGEEKILELES